MGLVQCAIPAHAFQHPGGLHTPADYARMSNKVAQVAHPWIDSYNQLTAVAEANLSWGWAPVGQIFRCGSGCNNNFARSQKDALAIYYLSLRYWITGDTNYANKAIQGMDAWSSTMTNGVGGDSNWALGAGLCGYEFAVGGEALRGYAGWSQTSISNYCNFLKLFQGGNDSFLSSHNGTCDSHYWCNWDACNVASLITIGVFCDDTNMFNRAVSYIQSGKGNGNMTSAAWYIHPNGLAQWEESGRDQAHTMDGIAWLGVACQVAWNQGVDLYGMDNNLFLRGLEYSAKYNLFNAVPFASFGTCDTGEDWGTTALSSGSQGFLPPTWDLFYNHYVNVLGLAAPYTAQAAAKLRPDGFYNNSNSPDFVGFTTLTSLADPTPAGVPPSGLVANVSGQQVNLTWHGSAYANSYNVKRAATSGGPYTTVGTVSASADRVFVDTTVTSGSSYYYVVSAVTGAGETANSDEIGVTILNQLLSYYKFDESSGTTAADTLGFNSPANLMNGAAFAPGKYGNAVSLNGSSQYVALPSGLITGLGDFTIATWVYLNSVNTWARLFDFGADTDRYMFLSPYSGSGTLRFSITKFSGHGEEQINGPALTAGAWHHVAVTLQGTDGTGVGILYVDGSPVGTNSAMSFYPDMIGSLMNATNNYIGRSAFSGDPYLNGFVDDFRIYSGALSATQISSLAASAPPLAPAAPAGLSATAASANQINLSWSASTGATSYNVYAATVNGGPYTLLANGVTGTSYSSDGFLSGTTYYFVVAALNDGGKSPNSAQVSATTLIPPAAPTGLAAAASGTQVTVSWNPTTGATSYNVKRSAVSGGPYATIATGVTSTNYSDTAAGGTLYYVVSAVNGNGESANSGEASATTAPAAPTGLSALVADSQIAVSWGPSVGANSYNLKRATTSGGPYTTIATGLTGAGPYATVQYIDSTVRDGTTYYYVASAVSAAGEGPNSAEISATPVAAALTAYLKFDETSGTTAADSTGDGWTGTLVNGATFVAGYSNNAVKLASASSQYVTLPGGVVSALTNFTVALWVNLASVANWNRIFDIGNGTTDYMFVTPQNGNTGKVRFAINTGGGEQQVNSSSTLSLNTWHHVAVTLFAGNAVLYIDGLAVGTNYAMTLTPASLGSTTNNYIGKSQFADPYLNGNVDEFRLYNNALSSHEVAVLANIALPIPTAPTGLAATGGNGVVNLAWVQSTSPAITTNNIYRSTSGSGGPYNALASLAATNAYADIAVANGSTYYYAVSAVNTGGESALSSYAGATTAPAAPTGLTATAGNAQVALNWNASTGATSYNVKRATADGGPYTTIASGIGTASYTDTTAVNGTTYYYVVSAVNSGGESANSTQVSAMPGIFAYLKFDETSGTTASDSTGHGWNGTLVNGATWVAGYSNNAVNLNGTNQYVSLPTGVVSSLTNCTVAGWVNLSTVSTWNRIFDFGSGGVGSTTGKYMFLSPKGGSGVVRFAITAAGYSNEQQINGTAALPSGGWHHVAVTLAGSVGVLYVDRVPVGTNSAMTLNPSSLGSSTQNWIGRSQYSTDPYLKGNVDEFRIYSSALTAAQISALP